MKVYLRDHIDCGGGGCLGCGMQGTETAPCTVPPAGFVPRADDDGFERDRESCPCYEGIKINDGVDQCGHPANREPENWCAPDVCPLLRATQPAGDVGSSP